MLPKAILNAFTNDSKEEALTALRIYLNDENNNISAEAHHQASVLEEQYGDWRRAGASHNACIQLAANNPVGLLYAGHWLKTSGFDEGAAALFSLCQDLNPSFIGLIANSGQSTETIKRSNQADTHLRNYLSNHHRQTLNAKKASRIQQAAWVRTHDETIDTKIAGKLTHYAPSLFFIDQLKKQPSYSSAEFAWANELLRQRKAIKAELGAFLASKHNVELIRPYLQGAPNAFEGMNDLVNSANWSAIDLFRDGDCSKQIESAFPKTITALAQVPCYQLEETPFEVFFSILKPGQIISSHYGQSNHSLTVHLPIDIPDHCYLDVDSERLSWQQDDLLIFDDNFLHSASNKSARDRIVLIFSIWHPDLSKNERTSIQTAFKARMQWLKQRWTLVNRDFAQALIK